MGLADRAGLDPFEASAVVAAGRPSSIRRRSLVALQRISPQADACAVAVGLATLKDENRTLRTEAVKLLGAVALPASLEDAEVGGALEGLVEDSDRYVRRALVDALHERLGKRHF